MGQQPNYRQLVERAEFGNTNKIANAAFTLCKVCI